MSTSETKTGIKWTAKNSSAPKNRARKKYFEKEYGLATRGIYDEEDKLDALRRRKLEERQQSSESGESDSSSDESDSSSESERDERDSSDSEREFLSARVTSVKLADANYFVDEEW